MCVESASISKLRASMASPALMAVESSNSTCTALNPLLTGSWSMMSSWTKVKL